MDYLNSNDIEKGFIPFADDLSQLRLVDAQSVRDLAENINSFPPGDLANRKRVIVMATGGTVAMKMENGIRIPAFSCKDIFGLIDPQLQDNFLLHGLNAFNLDSSQMNYMHARDLAIVATYLWRQIHVPFLGFLVLHGTDTMAYTSAAMSLMLGQGLPFSIVYTGAQRPINDPINDVTANIRHALYTLEALHARDMAEVVIVMGERALLATSAEKVDDSSINAFAAPRHCYVSNFNRLEYPVRLAEWLNPRRRIPFEPKIWHGDFSHTMVIHSMLGLSPDAVARQVSLPDVHAVILYSYGAGTIYEGILNAVMPLAKQRNMPVFIVNPVNSDYRVEYSSNQLAVLMGAMPLDMTLPSALAKIEIGLRLHPGDVKGMARFMSSNFVGEIAANAARFSPGR